LKSKRQSLSLEEHAPLRCESAHVVGIEATTTI